jgi:hypothetical protein
VLLDPESTHRRCVTPHEKATDAMVHDSAPNPVPP